MNGIVVKPDTQVWDAPNGNVVTKLDKGTVIKIVEMEGGWVKFFKVIQGKLRKGYISKNDVEPEVLWKGVVKVQTWLNVRKGPGTSHEILAKLNGNDKVLVLDKVEGEAVNGETGWLEIMHKDGTAFIFAKYVEKIGDAGELTSTVRKLDGEGQGDATHAGETSDWSDVKSTLLPGSKPIQNKPTQTEVGGKGKDEPQNIWNKINSFF